MAPPIVILTGAGISQESGIATFRDADGLWARHRIEDVATPEAFARNPDLVQRFYNARRAQLLDPAIQPNAAHLALARLEAAWPAPVLLVTQNIDGLHARAGSRNLIPMHGELQKARCLGCQGVVDWQQDITPQSACPACGAVAGCARMWFGSAKCHFRWNASKPRYMNAACSFPSAHQARFIPLLAWCAKYGARRAVWN